jgi:heme oxygenase (mycobilin-producing)
MDDSISVEADAAAANDGLGGFVAVNRLVVDNSATRQMREAFRKRRHLVERARGFLRMDVICPRERPEEFWLITFWTDQSRYETWLRGIPKALKLVPIKTQMRFFSHICT